MVVRWRFVGIMIGLYLFSGLSSVRAGDIEIKLPISLGQETFKNFSKEAGLAISYLPLSPAEPLGLLGSDLGVEVTAAKISNDTWKPIVPSPPDYLVLPKLHVQKGLPWGFDIGAVYSKIPQSNISMVGGEIKWAIIGGNLVLPSVALRGSYTKLLGVDSLALETIGANISISKGFAFATPYAGAGFVLVKSAGTLAGLNLSTENLRLPQAFVGIKVSLVLINFVAEASFSEVPTYSGRFNVGF